MSAGPGVRIGVSGVVPRGVSGAWFMGFCGNEADFFFPIFERFTFGAAPNKLGREVRVIGSAIAHQVHATLNLGRATYQPVLNWQHE